VSARWPLLIPIGAFVFVAAMILVTVALSGADSEPAAAVPTATAVPDTPTPLPTGGGRVSPELPSISVCQSVFARREAGGEQQFDPEYTQIRTVLGISIVAGPGVTSDALEAAEETIRRMFLNNDLEQALEEAQAYVIVAEPNQDVLDLPEFSCLEDSFGAEFFERVCGVADRAAFPVVTVNTLDLLGDPSGPCGGVNILFHELGHMIETWAMAPADYFDARLLHHDAVTAGLYEGEYAATNFREYWAEGTQAFFLHSDRSGERDREWLKGYDPALYDLLTEVFGEGGE
jgi:hypothetical protein